MKALHLLTDLSNAFGSSDCEIILDKFARIMDKKSYDLIKSFLSQSNIRVSLDGELSEEFKTAPRGYAQGSCISPLLFCMLMTDTHKLVKHVCHSFADDATFTIYGKTDSELIENTIECIKEFDAFCHSLNIKLNVSKTLYIYHKDLDIKYNGTVVKQAPNKRLLGMRIDHKINFTPQQDHIIGEAGTVHAMTAEYGQTTSEIMLGTIIKSNYHGKIQHGLPYMEPWCPSKYNKVQIKVNNMIRRRVSDSILGQFLRQSGLIQEGEDLHWKFESTGTRLLDQELKDLELQKKIILDTAAETDKGSMCEIIEKRKAKIKNEKWNIIHAKNTLNDQEMQVVKNQILWRDRKRVSDGNSHFNKLNLPQGLLLKRLNMLNIQNLHKLAMLNRMHKLLRTQRPVEEFNIIHKYLNSRFLEGVGPAYREIRPGANFPYFKYNIEHENYVIAKLETCVPKIWFDEYHTISRDLRKMLIQKGFVKHIKRDLHARCQHKILDTEECALCRTIPNNSNINRARRMIIDLAESERTLEQTLDSSITDSLEFHTDGIYTEVSWDELGTEIFSTASYIPRHLVTLISNLSELE